MRRTAPQQDLVALALLGVALLAAFALGRWSALPQSALPKSALPKSALPQSALPMGLVGEAASPDASAPEAPRIGAYRAIVTRVIDGDTVEARIPIWLGQEVITKVRLRGIDAPEIAGACGAERNQAEIARARLMALIGDGPVMLTEIGPDKYAGRVVARLHAGKPGAMEDAGARLVSEGHARRYDGKRREGWCRLAGG